MIYFKSEYEQALAAWRENCNEFALAQDRYIAALFGAGAPHASTATIRRRAEAYNAREEQLTLVRAKALVMADIRRDENDVADIDRLAMAGKWPIVERRYSRLTLTAQAKLKEVWGTRAIPLLPISIIRLEIRP